MASTRALRIPGAGRCIAAYCYVSSGIGESASIPSPRGSSLDHIGTRTDNLEAVVADLKAKGVQFRDETRKIRAGIKLSLLWAPQNVPIELQEGSI